MATITAVRLFPVGRLSVPGPEVFFQRRFGERLPLTLWAALLSDGMHRILINAGPHPADVDLLPDVTTLVPDGLAGQLAREGIAPHMVTHLILTPLQAYAIGGVHEFPRAQIMISRRGWIDFHAPPFPTSTAARHRAVPDRILHRWVGEDWKRMVLVGNRATVVPGVNVTWVGCHHRSSLAIWVQTPGQRLVFTDSVFYADNVEHMVPIGIAEERQECLQAYEAFRRDADAVLGLYDPGLADRYPEGFVVGRGLG